MKLREFIVNNGLDELINNFAIKATYHQKYPYLVQLVYDQLNTPKNDITNDCRGIIFDTRDWSIVSFPFTRFTDYNKSVKTNFDFTDYKVYEKIDGSLMTMYFHDSKWHISTKSVPDANGLILGTDFGDIRYADYFWQIYTNLDLPINLNENYCYIFEFKFPSKTQFIVEAYSETITLLGVRDLTDLKEINLENVDFPCKSTVLYDDDISFEELLLKSYYINPTEREGYVIVDKNFNRLKIKSPAYNRIGLLKRSESDSAKADNFKILCSIVKLNYYNDFLINYQNCILDYSMINSAVAKMKYVLHNELEKTKHFHSKEVGIFSQTESKFGKMFFNFHKRRYIGYPIETLLFDMDNNKFIELVRKFM